jgi:hypothetical protein
VSARPTPHPFPMRLRDQVNIDLRSAGITSSDARYVVRRMVADAYAEGFDDGRTAGTWDAATDRQDQEESS